MQVKKHKVLTSNKGGRQHFKVSKKKEGRGKKKTTGGETSIAKKETKTKWRNERERKRYLYPAERGTL